MVNLLQTGVLKTEPSECLVVELILDNIRKPYWQTQSFERST